MRWLEWIARRLSRRTAGNEAAVAAAASAESDEHIPAVVEIEIGPVLDLHSFPPAEIREIVDAYLEEAAARRLREVRIIHGRGRGVQRRIVRSLLARHPLVERFADAEPARGGWGATIAWLREP